MAEVCCVAVPFPLILFRLSFYEYAFSHGFPLNISYLVGMCVSCSFHLAMRFCKTIFQ